MTIFEETSRQRPKRLNSGRTPLNARRW